jgi:CBS domain-containing protein
MSSPVYVVFPTENIAYARNLMVKHHISRLVVMEEGRIRGIITKKDIGYRLRKAEPEWRRRPIDQIPIGLLMVPDPVTVAPDTGIREIAALFVERGISSVPVVENGALAGIVTKSDLMRSSLFSRLNLSVSDVMEDVITVSRYHSLDHVIDMMSERYDKLVVVNNDGTLAGVITETNLAFHELMSIRPGFKEKDVKFLRREEHAGTKRFRYVIKTSVIAEDVMSHPVVTIGRDAPLKDAIRLMQEHRVSSVVVADGTDILGIVRRDDIVKEVAK